LPISITQSSTERTVAPSSLPFLPPVILPLPLYCIYSFCFVFLNCAARKDDFSWDDSVSFLKVSRRRRRLRLFSPRPSFFGALGPPSKILFVRDGAFVFARLVWGAKGWAFERGAQTPPSCSHFVLSFPSLPPCPFPLAPFFVLLRSLRWLTTPDSEGVPRLCGSRLVDRPSARLSPFSLPRSAIAPSLSKFFQDNVDVKNFFGLLFLRYSPT